MFESTYDGTPCGSKETLNIVAPFVWRNRLTYIGIALILYCGDNKDWNHVGNRINIRNQPYSTNSAK